MNTNALTRIAGLDLSALAGPWLMAEGRVKALHARVAGLIAGGVTPQVRANSDASGLPDESYGIIGGVAVIKVVGLLTKYPMPDPFFDEWCGFCPTVPIVEALNEAMADERVKEIAFLIDSPGGMVAGTSELTEAIAAADKIKPCRAIVSDLAASGGYYIASQCRSITCNAMGEVGCIGVYGVLVDDSKFYESLGIEFTVISSGGVKGLGADGKVTQEFKDDQKRGVMAMYEKFIADVAKGREHAGLTPEQARAVGTGQTWLAKEAVGLRLIDSIASAADALSAINLQLTGAVSPAASPAPQVGKNAAKSGNDVTLSDTRTSMNPKKRAYLESVGLRSDATDEDATTFYNLLSADKQTAADAAEAAEEVAVEETVAATNDTAVVLASIATAASAKAIHTGSPLPDLITACDGNKAVAADYFVAGMNVDQAQAAYGAVKSANAAVAEAQAETKRAQFAAGGPKPVALAAGGGNVETAPTDAKAAEVTAKAEYSKMSKADRDEWSDEGTYVAYRKRELARGK